MANTTHLGPLLLRLQQHGVLAPLLCCSNVTSWLNSASAATSTSSAAPAASTSASQRHYTKGSKPTTRFELPPQTDLHPSLDPARVSPWSQRARANLKYCQERAAWRRQMTALRKQWLEELQQQASHRQVSRVRDSEERQLLRASCDAIKQQNRERLRMERELRDAERAVEVAERKLQGAARQSLRQTILQEAREKRAEEMLLASRTWIPREALQSRIQHALDNPVPL